MNGFAAWAMSILGVVILGTIFDLLLPGGKMSKFLRSVFATLTVLIIVTPLPALFKKESSNISDFFEGGSIELDQGYLDYILQNRAKVTSDALEEGLKEKGYENLKITVTLNADLSIKAVVIYLSNSVIDQKNPHINKYELIKAAAKLLNINEDLVVVYE